MCRSVRMSLLLGCLLLVVLVGAKDTVSRRSKDRFKETRKRDKPVDLGTSSSPTNSSTSTMNVCELMHLFRVHNLYCHCESNEPNTATKADCWVYGTGENETSPLWDSFSAQSNLRTLSFMTREQYGQKFVPTKSLSFLRKLQSLEISSGNIHEVLPYAFANLSLLQELKLSGNNIVILKPKSFAWLSNLTVVNLEENKILEINRSVFIGLPSLRSLYLNHNSIATVQDKAFSYLSALEDLDLFNNQISIITRETFDGLKSLNRLQLADNRISMLGDCTFCEMPQLTHLNLDGNRLSFVSVRAFENLSRLLHLDIQNNKLLKLQLGTLNPTPHLLYLALTNNSLETLTVETVRPIMDNFYNVSSHLYLQGNLFLCDCRLAWLITLRNETPVDHIRESLDSTTCIMSGGEYDVSAPVSSRGGGGASERRAPFGSPGNTNGLEAPDFIQDEGIVQVPNDNYFDSVEERGKKSDQEVVDDDSGILKSSGMVKNIHELKSEELPCPEKLRHNSDSSNDLDLDVHQELEMTGVQTLTGSASAWSSSTLLWIVLGAMIFRPHLVT